MMRALRTRMQAGWLLALGLACGPALAHKGSDAYLDVQQLEQAARQPASAGAENVRDFRFVLAVAIRDLDLVVPIDANADASVTWGEVKAAIPQVLAHAGSIGKPAGWSAAATASIFAQRRKPAARLTRH